MTMGILEPSPHYPSGQAREEGAAAPLAPRIGDVHEEYGVGVWVGQSWLSSVRTTGCAALDTAEGLDVLIVPGTSVVSATQLTPNPRVRPGR